MPIINLDTCRVALVSRRKPSEWVSCRTIVTELRNAYQNIFGTEMTEFTQTPDLETTYQTAWEIFSFRPTLIVFIDHSPNPAPLIFALSQRYKNSPKPKMVIHIYGDFSINTHQWLKVEKELLDWPLKLIAASERQKNLIENFLVPTTDLVDFCPFPVNTAEFEFSAPIRDSMRRKLGITSKDLVLLYAGRITQQKNVEKLICELFRLWNRHLSNLKLLICGPFHDMGSPIFGRFRPLNYQYYGYNKLKLFYPSAFSQRIHYLGDLTSAELSQVQLAADSFVSLSTYHDEDFGVAVAEALSSGLPPIITDWAGYSSFDLSKAKGAFMPVKLTEQGIVFDCTQLEAALKSIDSTKHDLVARKQISTYFSSLYSSETISHKFRDILNCPFGKFRGFSWIAKILAEKIENKMVLYANGETKNSLYEEVYNCYYGDK